MNAGATWVGNEPYGQLTATEIRSQRNAAITDTGQIGGSTSCASSHISDRRSRPSQLSFKKKKLLQAVRQVLHPFWTPRKTICSAVLSRAIPPAQHQYAGLTRQYGSNSGQNTPRESTTPVHKQSAALAMVLFFFRTKHSFKSSRCARANPTADWGGRCSERYSLFERSFAPRAFPKHRAVSENISICTEPKNESAGVKNSKTRRPLTPTSPLAVRRVQNAR